MRKFINKHAEALIIAAMIIWGIVVVLIESI